MEGCGSVSGGCRSASGGVWKCEWRGVEVRVERYRSVSGGSGSASGGCGSVSGGCGSVSGGVWKCEWRGVEV